MKGASFRARSRWLLGAAGALAIAGLAVAFVFSVPVGRASDVASVSSRSFNSYASVAARPKNLVNACRAAGGVCVGLERGACARGPIGNATIYPCGDTSLQCCLPERRSSGGGAHAP